MKIGIFTDVHNNVIALNAVLKLFEEKGCEDVKKFFYGVK